MGTSKRLAGNLLPFETDTSVDALRLGLLPAPALPVRCGPLKDELLSSWLIRLAWLNAEKLHTFRRRFWRYPGSPWGRNIDLTLPDDALDEIATMSLVPRETLVAHMLRSYAGRLYENVNQHGTAPGILAGRLRGQKMLGFGLQLCSECMRTGTSPYFRRWWKVAYMVSCPIHKCLLIDACPCCKQPLVYHTSDFGKILLPEYVPTAFCANCGYHWGANSNQNDAALTDEFIEWQGQMLEALRTGWIESHSTGPLYALSFFQGLRILIRLIAANGYCSKLRGVIARELGILPLAVTHPGDQNIFSGMRLADRLYLLRYAYWLLQEWPERFIWVTKTARIAYSYIDSYRNYAPLPYWVASVAEYARDYRHSRVSVVEKESVKRFLENHELPVSANQINRWLGRWYVRRSPIAQFA